MSERSRRWRRRIVFALGTVVVVGMTGVLASRLFIDTIGPPVIGTVDGELSACPDVDNCVRSGASDPRHATDPLTCPDADVRAVADLLVRELERTTIAAVVGDYAHLEVRSQVLGFVDDLELLADGDVLQIRSAARLGRGDLGVNRERVERVRTILASAEQCA